MKIPTSSESQKSFSLKKKFLWGFIFLSIYTTLGIYFAKGVYQQGYYDRFTQAINVVERIPGNYINSLGAHIETLKLDITHKQYVKLNHKREQALKKGVLIQSDDDYVSAQLTHNDKKVDIRIRLKGDWTDHLETEKWSFRVKVKGEDSVMGIKNFSLQHPKTRNYMYEWIYQKFMKYEGIINIRYHFVELIINGKNKGIFALEEHFEKRLIENNHLKESPIFRFDESLVWEDIVKFPNFNDAIWDEEALKSVQISPFVKSSLKENPSLRNNYIYAATLLDGFRSKKLKASEVFDSHKIATFLALQDLLGAHHGAGVFNSIFYYNPNTSKVEPISFDGDSGKLVNKPYLYSNYRNPLVSQILEDRDIFQKYIQKLEQFKEKEYIDKVFNTFQSEFDHNSAILHREYPEVIFNIDDYYSNQEFISSTLNLDTYIYAYSREITPNQIQISFENIRIFPIHIQYIELINGQKIKPIGDKILEQKRNYYSYPKQKIINFPIDVSISDAILQSPLKVHFNILGSKIIHNTNISPWPKNRIEWYYKNPLGQKSNLENFPFFKKTNSNTYSISSGNHLLSQNLYIPKGLKIISTSPFTLTLSHNSSIYSQSAFDLKPKGGTITIQSDLTGAGVYLYNCPEKSFFSNVNFKNLSNPNQDSWALTGAVTLYQSDVYFENCRFENSQCEDSLNIVRSSFELNHCQINHSKSDAFDADFCHGRISYSQFHHNGNDAIDISGSNIDMKNITINSSGDKALSAGEKSTMKGKHIKIINSEVGVASKDQSEVNIDFINITNTRVAFTAYKKKSEFGPANVNIGAHIKTKDIEELGLVEEGSSITINSKKIEVNSEKVKELMYGNEYGRASR